ncbi:hypothetical protein DFQ26_007345 [Actinomortierella ambigua]|nr:hypothetical protein DFQ26_007345 [Actinomortierella ambigua]
MVSITTGMSNLSTSTGGSRAPDSSGVSGRIAFTARPGVSSRLAARLSTLEGQYAERVKEMLSLFDDTLHAVAPPIVEELELMVTSVDQLLDDAQNGVAEAQYKLGRKYIQALGVEPDFEEGMRLLEQAADHGHAEALFRSALTTILWINTPDADEGMVESWLQRASDDGHVLANTLLQVLRLKGSTDDEKVKDDVVKVLEAREAGGDGVASTFLGFLCVSSKHVDKAMYYAERATMRGQVEGACLLGNWLEEGCGVTVDLARAAKLDYNQCHQQQHQHQR